jgi:hypothetical protein
MRQDCGSIPLSSDGYKERQSLQRQSGMSNQSDHLRSYPPQLPDEGQQQTTNANQNKIAEGFEWTHLEFPQHPGHLESGRDSPIDNAHNSALDKGQCGYQQPQITPTPYRYICPTDL